MVDREDNLWIGFSGGLQRLANRQGLRNFYPGILDGHIYSLFEDARERIWITSDQGSYYFNDGQLVRFSTRNGLSEEMHTGTLLPDGNILLAGNDMMVEVDRNTLRVMKTSRFNPADGSPETIFVSSRGEIFLLTGAGGSVYYFRSFDAEPVQINNRFTDNLFQLIEYEGQVIGGNNEGFVVFDGDGFRLLETSPCRIWSMKRDGENIWVGTDCGLGRVKDGRFDQMERDPLEGTPAIRSILPARNRNYLWLGTNNGFIHYNMTNGDPEIIIRSADGLSGDEITPGGLLLDSHGLVWIGTHHGVSNFNIRARSGIHYAPVCYIEKFLVNGEKTEPENGQVFPHDQNNVQFEISALYFAGEGLVEYEYYLRGLRNLFSSYHRGSGYQVSYNNLPPGRYEFIYRAKGNNNIWGYAEKYSFTIRKAWHQTWGFRSVVLILIAGILILLYLARIRSLKSRHVILEQQLREKEHDLLVARKEIDDLQNLDRLS